MAKRLEVVGFPFAFVNEYYLHGRASVQDIIQLKQGKVTDITSFKKKYQLFLMT